MSLHLAIAAALPCLCPSLARIGSEVPTQTEIPLDIALLGLPSTCDGFRPPEPDEGEAGTPSFEPVASAALPAQANLRVVGITHSAYVYPDNTCSVILYVRVQNAGNATAWSFSVGAKGWGTPTIATCTGTWRAFNTTANLAAGQSRTVTVYGPGYVGPRVLRGTALTITGGADVHCTVAESSESDNTRSARIQVGS